MWIVDLFDVCKLLQVDTLQSDICFPVCLLMRSRVSTKSMNLEYIFVCFKRAKKFVVQTFMLMEVFAGRLERED